MGGRRPLARWDDRNLNHPTESPESDKYINHCLGVVWSVESLNLADLCESCGLDLSSPSSGRSTTCGYRSSMLVPGRRTARPQININPRENASSEQPHIEWDRIFIVVNHRNTRKLFDDCTSSVETN